MTIYAYQYCEFDKHCSALGRQYGGPIDYLTHIEQSRNRPPTSIKLKSGPENSTVPCSPQLNRPASTLSAGISTRPPTLAPTQTQTQTPASLLSSSRASSSRAPSSPALSLPSTRCCTPGGSWCLSTAPLPLTVFNCGTDMLNPRGLSDLLTMNVHQTLYPRMFVMSPNGTLLAYSTPANIRELRDQATVASVAWREHIAKMSAHSVESNRRPDSPQSTSSSTVSQGSLETITMEFSHGNLLVRAVQPTLLLVMVGGTPPGSNRELKVTPELNGSPRYPPTEFPRSRCPSEGSGSTSPDRNCPRNSPGNLSTISQRDRDVKLGPLHIQRRRLDVLTKLIRDEFDASGFVMPDNAQFQ